jgi:hypothetical protein
VTRSRGLPNVDVKCPKQGDRLTSALQPRSDDIYFKKLCDTLGRRLDAAALQPTARDDIYFKIGMTYTLNCLLYVYGTKNLLEIKSLKEVFGF